MDAQHEDAIVDAWGENARPWTAAVREKRIESRKRVTDRAVVEAVLACAPHSMLDVGCGEGWLVRALAGHGIRGIGVDTVPELIEAARAAGGGEFHAMPYAGLAADTSLAPVDTLVCNFSLLGRDSVEAVFRAAPARLNPRGRLLVQTLHPVAANGDLPYRDGWREGSWAGCGAGFGKPAPWYFRTLESWVALFADHGLALTTLHEPVHPDSGRPASLILVGRLPA